jgi:hypothetical protein
LRSDLLEFAKDPEVGIEQLGPEPLPPSNEALENKTDREKAQALQDYETMKKIYNDRKAAMEHHVSHSDFVIIADYLQKFEKTLYATPAVKGLRFKAFTKDVEHPEEGALAKLFKRSSQSA